MLTVVFIREVVSLADSAMPQVKRIYTDSFRPEERLGDWYFDECINSRARLPRPGSPVYHLLVAQEQDSICGVSFSNYFLDERDGSPVNLGALAYLAVQSEQRNRGIGARLYTATLALLALDAQFHGQELSGMTYTVERPDEATEEAERSLRERRIGFYRRLGAQLLENVVFMNPPLREQDVSFPLHIMYHPVALAAWEPEDLNRTLGRLIAGLREDIPPNVLKSNEDRY